MTGTQQSAIDFAWLLANLEIAEVPTGVDDRVTGTVPTFVIGPKAIQAAESYVLGLFQLYQSVYFHKTTRGAEKLFEELMVRVLSLILDGSARSVGLPAKHPLVRFAKSMGDLEIMLLLDDSLVWGALSLLEDSKDEIVASLSRRLRDRKLYKCFDVRAAVAHRINPQNERSEELIVEVDRKCESIQEALINLQGEANSDEVLRLLVDKGHRSPYGKSEVSQDPTGRINVRTQGGALVDLKQRSDVVGALQEFKLLRVYYAEDDERSLDTVKSLVR